MKFIKKHPVLCVLVVIILILLIALFFVFKSLLVGGSRYGNRLDGIDKVVISNDTLSKVCSKFKENDKVSSCNTRLSGKILYTSVILSSSVDTDDMKGTSSDVLEYFSESEIGFYDFQFLIGINDLDNNDTYPIIGYKNNDSDSISWNSNGDE